MIVVGFRRDDRRDGERDFQRRDGERRDFGSRDDRRDDRRGGRGGFIAMIVAEACAVTDVGGRFEARRSQASSK